MKSRCKIFNVIKIKIYLTKFYIITIKDLQFDISFSHMRYNKTAVDVIFKPETFKFSILRNPIEQFLSSYLYYRNWTNSLTSKILGKDGILHINSELERFLKVSIFYILRKLFRKTRIIENFSESLEISGSNTLRIYPRFDRQSSNGLFWLLFWVDRRIFSR